MKGDRWMKVEFAVLLVGMLVTLWPMVRGAWVAIAALF
jgi:hypothetical protein